MFPPHQRPKPMTSNATERKDIELRLPVDSMFHDNSKHTDVSFRKQGDYFSTTVPRTTMSTHQRNAISYKNLIANLKQSWRGPPKSRWAQSNKVNSVTSDEVPLTTAPES